MNTYSTELSHQILFECCTLICFLGNPIKLLAFKGKRIFLSQGKCVIGVRIGEEDRSLHCSGQVELNTENSLTQINGDVLVEYSSPSAICILFIAQISMI